MKRVQAVLGKTAEHLDCIQDKEITWSLTYVEASDVLIAYKTVMNQSMELLTEGLASLLTLRNEEQANERLGLLIRLKEQIEHQENLYEKISEQMAAIWQNMTPEQERMEVELHSIADDDEEKEEARVH